MAQKQCISEPLTNENVKIMGRHMFRNGVLYIDYSASYVEFEFTGTRLSARIRTDNAHGLDIFVGYAAVFVNEEEEPALRFALDEDEKEYPLFSSDTPVTVKIRLMKYCEAAFGKMGIIALCHDGTVKKTPYRERTIEFIGDSITCGYGIEGVWNVDSFSTKTQNPKKAFAVRTAELLDADFQLFSWSGNGIISGYIDESVDKPSDDFLIPYIYPYTDAGGSAFAGDKEWELWDMRRFDADVIVINLGTNDKSYTRGYEDRIRLFGDKYAEFLRYLRRNHEKAHIFCTLGAMGQELCPEIARQVSLLSKEDKKLHYMEFPVQTEADGIGADWHPSEKTHIKMANRLAETIRQVMHWQ